MRIDLESALPSASEPFRSQVCIVGGGIAGLVLATTLANAGIDVHLLEAGDSTFGGSSTPWDGQLLPYADDIFSPPPGVPSAGWPIWRSELSRFYPQVEDLLGTGHQPYAADIYRDFGRTLPAALLADPALVLRASKWAPFSPRDLAQTLGEQALASPHAAVFFHANAREILPSPDGSRIAAVLVRDYRGNEFRFEADQYVLATDTIETSRLLLTSRSVAPAGVGNDHDQVGRGFHNHISYPAAVLAGKARRQFLEWFAPVLDDDVTRTAKLEASPALRQRLGLLNVMAHLSIEEPEDSGVAVVRSLLQSIQRGDLRNTLVGSLPKLPGASFDIARLAYDARYHQRRFVSSGATVALHIDCEQRARPENRIRLDESATDALGLPRTIVDWRVSTDELRSLRIFADFLRVELPRLGTEEIAWQAELADPDPEAPLTGITDTDHPMGGCIMGANPATSVVDPDLHLHGVPNLSLASCATYPSGGSSSPILTLMALTLRLAERLQHVLAIH